MGEGMHDPREVANFVLRVRRRKRLPTTHLELQKLVYFAHGYLLSRFSQPLVEGHFEAWKDGPVHPYLYDVFKKYGREPITEYAYSVDPFTRESRLPMLEGDNLAKRVVASIVIQLRDLSASELRHKSHVEFGPWHSVWQSAKTNLASSLRIPDSVIQKHYARHLVSEVADGDEEDAFEDYPPEFYRRS
jgi:uncharacterized phage-associated protein